MSITRTCPDCGYASSDASAAVGDSVHRRHSCAKHRRTAEQRRRQAERAQTRVRRDCVHPCASHAHGTRAAYVKDRCRCIDCTAANTAAGRAVHRAQTLGRWQPFIDAAPVREHVRALRASGIGVQQITALTGVSASHVRTLADPGRRGKPPIQRVRPNTARRVLSVSIQAANRAPHSRVEATGTRRRLQALMAIGWTETQLATRLYRSTTSLRRTMRSTNVTARTAADVDALYRGLWNSHPPRSTDAQRAAAEAARAHAADRGWLPPLAWDDIDTDPELGPCTVRPAPDEDLDQIAIERAIAGDGIRLNRLTPAEQEEVIRRLTQRGKSIRDIAEQLATTKRTVSRRRTSIGAR